MSKLQVIAVVAMTLLSFLVGGLFGYEWGKFNG